MNSTDEIKEWEDRDNIMFIIFSIISCVCIIVQLLVCIIVTVILIIKRQKHDIPSFVFVQLALTMVNELLFGTDILLNYFYIDAADLESVHIIISAGILTFILSQWVFVYQYMKVALLMPFILKSDDTQESINDEERAHNILQCTNISFVAYAVACIAANEIFRFTDLDKMIGKIRLFDILPYLVLVGVLLFSIYKIKQMVRDYVFLNTRKDLMTFMILCFITFSVNWIFIIPTQAYY